MIETGVFVPRRLASARSRRVIYHAVQPGYQLALCFAEPGQGSGWAEPAGERVTCTHCLARLSRLIPNGRGTMPPCGDGTSAPYTLCRRRMCRSPRGIGQGPPAGASRRRHRSRHRMTMTNDKLPELCTPSRLAACLD